MHRQPKPWVDVQYIRRSIRERAAEVAKGGQLGVFSDDRVASQVRAVLAVWAAAQDSPQTLGPAMRWRLRGSSGCTWTCSAQHRVRERRVLRQALIEGYLKPMKAVDWDKGSLYGFRAMSFPSYLNYEQVSVPVQIIHGEHDRGLKKAAKQVRNQAVCSQGTLHALSPAARACSGLSGMLHSLVASVTQLPAGVRDLQSARGSGD